MSTPQVIRFYEEYKPYGYFSNFASCPIFLKGKLWPTTEHYYQAQKYAGTDYEEAVRQAPSPMTSKEMTRDAHHPPRPDWDAVKDGVMRDALLAKFTQHDHLQSLLLETGDAYLVEHTANDNYWGDGGDGTGKNKLGELLMEVRSDIRRRLA
jgi:hypothetical protein